MGLLNPYIGMKRDDTGYYLDVAEASGSPYYQQEGQGARLQAAAKNGRAYLNDFDPIAGTSMQIPVLPDGNTGGAFGTAVMRAITDNRFKNPATARADQQYQTDKDVAQIAQTGREETKRAQLSSEIAYAQDAARRAAVDQQSSGTVPGVPDVDLNTGGAVEDEGGGSTNGNTRRKRSAYQGAGLKI